jgi:hypothetical protein
MSGRTHVVEILHSASSPPRRRPIRNSMSLLVFLIEVSCLACPRISGKPVWDLKKEQVTADGKFSP